MSFVNSLADIPWHLYALRVVALLVTWGIVYFLVRYGARTLDRFYSELSGQQIERGELRTLDTLLDWLLILGGVIVSLSILRLTDLLYSALAAAGVFGIAIGFAVKDVVANFVSGIFLLLDQPFVLGDSVEIGNISGTVEQVSLRSTLIRSSDGPLVHVPNSKLVTTPIVNYSAGSWRRLEITREVPRDQDLDRTMQRLLEIANAEPRLSRDKPPSVLVKSISSNSVTLSLICHAPSADWLDALSELQRAIAEAGL